MSELNRQLKEYLSQADAKGNEPLLPSIKNFDIMKVQSWFGKSFPPERDGLQTTISRTPSWCSFKQCGQDFCTLGRKQRIMGFIFFISLGLICFTLAAAYVPLLLIKSRKFSLLFTLGSLFTLMSFCFLWGPVNHVRYLFSADRLLFTSIYFVSLFGTLYFALSLQSTVLTTVAAAVQVCTLSIFVISSIPGGSVGLNFMSKICCSLIKKPVSQTLPI